jgi:hypothetical protein
VGVTTSQALRVFRKSSRGSSSTRAAFSGRVGTDYEARSSVPRTSFPRCISHATIAGGVVELTGWAVLKDERLCWGDRNSLRLSRDCTQFE